MNLCQILPLLDIFTIYAVIREFMLSSVKVIG